MCVCKRSNSYMRHCMEDMNLHYGNYSLLIFHQLKIKERNLSLVSIITYLFFHLLVNIQLLVVFNYHVMKCLSVAG